MGKEERDSGEASDQRACSGGCGDSAVVSKHCPIAYANPGWPVKICIGSKCALWETDKTQRRKGQGLGRCGLGGDVFKDPCG